jgi:hypothetical protein
MAEKATNRNTLHFAKPCMKVYYYDYFIYLIRDGVCVGGGGAPHSKPKAAKNSEPALTRLRLSFFA